MTTYVCDHLAVGLGFQTSLFVLKDSLAWVSRSIVDSILYSSAWLAMDISHSMHRVEEEEDFAPCGVCVK